MRFIQGLIFWWRYGCSRHTHQWKEITPDVWVCRHRDCRAWCNLADNRPGVRV